MLKSFIVLIFACNDLGMECALREEVRLSASSEADCIMMAHEIVASHATNAPVSAYECREPGASPRPLEGEAVAEDAEGLSSPAA